MATKRAAAAKKSAPVKKAASAKKAPAAKQAAPAKKAAPAKAPAAKKAAPAKAPAAKQAAPAKKAAPAKAPEPKTPVRSVTNGTARNGANAPRGKVKTPYDKKFLTAQHELLLKERATLATQAAALQDEADALARDREPGDVQFDDESGEGDTLAVERDFDLARAAAALQTIEEIDAAIERIEKGTYGVCEYSGEPIPKERLEAIPYARERVEYKTRSFR